MTGEQTQKRKPVLKDEDAEQIIATRKYIQEDAGGLLKKMKLKNGHWRATTDLICSQHNLKMLLRKTEDDECDFSVLLIYTDGYGSEYILRRYNGDHGRHTNPITREVMSGPHIHKITEDCQRTMLRGEGQAEATGEYQTLRTAIEIFMRDMNIVRKGQENNTKLTGWN